jgi:SAM-dependent methyltransferase
MWWFAAAHANLLAGYKALNQRIQAPDAAHNAPMLDAGCGTGGLLAKIAAEFPRRPVIGLDADRLAAARAGQKSERPVCVGSVNALPFADAVFAAIFSADVLCHRDVNEGMALGQFHRCLRREGLLILNLPAYRWMLSRHDIAVANVRRYDRHAVAVLLRAAGFRLVYATYWNAILFPLMVMTRKMLPARGAETSDVALQPPVFEAIGRLATAVERALLRCGLRLPFGGSLLAIAVKEEFAHA